MGDLTGGWFSWSDNDASDDPSDESSDSSTRFPSPTVNAARTILAHEKRPPHFIQAPVARGTMNVQQSEVKYFARQMGWKNAEQPGQLMTRFKGPPESDCLHMKHEQEFIYNRNSLLTISLRYVAAKTSGFG